VGRGATFYFTLDAKQAHDATLPHDFKLLIEYKS
jgi:hypothetical protein